MEGCFGGGSQSVFPILAGRLGVPISQGVEKVVEEIRFAVQTSEKQRQLAIAGRNLIRLTAYVKSPCLNYKK
jgi:hypothetical protein